MAGWAERKQRALARVHRTFERPAVYLTHAAGTPIPVNVRIHRKQIVDSLPQVDDWSNGAEAMTLADRIIFDRNEVGNVLPNSYVIYRPPCRPVEGYITGPTKWKPADITAPAALRPSVVILLAMMAAPGTSVLRDIYSINRGYEDLATRLNSLGAEIETVWE